MADEETTQESGEETPKQSFTEFREEKRAALTAEETPEGDPEPEAAKASDDAGKSEEGAGEQEPAAEEEPEADEEKPKRLSGYQRQKAKVEAAERRIADLEAKIEDLSKAAKPTEKKPAETSSDDDLIAPDPDDFDTDAEYAAANKQHIRKLVRREAEAILAERENAKSEKAQAEKAKREAKEFAEAHAKRVRKFAEDHKDYDEVMESLDDVQIPYLIQWEVIRSDVSDKLTYHLGKNRDELLELIDMEPADAVKAIGRLEARLQPEDNGRKRKPYKPPPEPPSKVSSGANPPGDLTQVKDFTEYRRRKRAEALKGQAS